MPHGVTHGTKGQSVKKKKFTQLQTVHNWTVQELTHTCECY
jgi:hypothetical protein